MFKIRSSVRRITQSVIERVCCVVNQRSDLFVLKRTGRVWITMESRDIRIAKRHAGREQRGHESRVKEEGEMRKGSLAHPR